MAADGVRRSDVHGERSRQPARGRSRLSLDRIRSASSAIDPVFLNTPQYRCDSLSDVLGCDIILKVETLNPVRSFKGRGASLFAGGQAKGQRIVTASAGNLGLALAWCCRASGVEVVVYAAETVSPLKLDRMRHLGATVILVGRDFDAAKTAAKAEADRLGLPMVEDGVEPALSEGAATIGAELLRHAEPIDSVLVSLGNGAILSGIATILKAGAPNIEIIGVAAAGAPCMALSLKMGKPVETTSVNTIADGLATRRPVPEALADLQGRIDDVLLVGDDDLLTGMRLVHRHAGLVIEPSAAAGIAAILADPGRFRGRSTAVILCGGNLTQAQIADWLTPLPTQRKGKVD